MICSHDDDDDDDTGLSSFSTDSSLGHDDITQREAQMGFSLIHM